MPSSSETGVAERLIYGCSTRNPGCGPSEDTVTFTHTTKTDVVGARRLYPLSYQVAVDVRRNPTPWYRAAAASVSYAIFTRWAPLVTRRSIPADSIARARPRRWNSSSTLTGSTSPTSVVGSNQYSE